MIIDEVCIIFIVLHGFSEGCANVCRVFMIPGNSISNDRFALSGDEKWVE